MFEHGVPLRLLARQAIEVHQRDRPLSLRPQHARHSPNGYQRDGHVRGMRGDAGRGGPQDGEFAVVALPRGTAAARHPLVAGLGDVLEVDAAGALQQVHAGGGQVAQLARSTGEHGLGEQGIAAADRTIGGEVAVAYQGADAHAPIGERFNTVIGASISNPAFCTLRIGYADPFVPLLYGWTYEAKPRSRRIDSMTQNVVLCVKTSAAASTPVYFAMTGAAAASVHASKRPFTAAQLFSPYF